jgi:hypothetical protein
LQFRRWEKKRKRFGEEQGDAAIAIADLFEANPDNFTCGHDGVEIAGAVIGNAGRKNFAFEFRSEERGALQIFNGVEERIESTTADGNTLPARGESGEGALLDGFDFTAKASEAFAANLLENFGVAPFLMLAARAEFAFEKFAATVECAKSGVYRGRLKGVARGQFMSGEWAVGTGVAAKNFPERIVGGG